MADNAEAKQGGTLNHIALYQKIASREGDIYDCLFGLLKSRNENIRLGAAKTLLNKILPDLRSTEVHGGLNGDGTTEPIRLLVNAGNGFIPATVTLQGASATSTSTTSTTVQSTNMASKGMEDNNSNNGDSQTSTP